MGKDLTSSFLAGGVVLYEANGRYGSLEERGGLGSWVGSGRVDS